MTHKKTRSIRDAISDIARRKHSAAQARSAGTPPDTESPRDVYLSACASIAESFEPLGYKYAKSGPHFRKRSKDFTFQISFQSSRNNVPGEHVCLWIHANVFSRRLKQWREQQPNVHTSDFVAGGQIGNLQTDSAWLEWELADPDNRQSQIDDAISTIKKLAVPYFALFDDLPSLMSRLTTDDLPSMTIGGVLEFLMCFSDQQTAKTAAANFLIRRHDLIQSYGREYKNYAERGLNPIHPTGYAKQLAFASHAFEFGDLSRTDA